MADMVRMTAPTKGGAGMRSTPHLKDGTRYPYVFGKQLEVDKAHVKELEQLGFTKYVAPQPEATPEQKDAPAFKANPFYDALEQAGISQSASEALIAAGYDTLEKVRDASDDDLDAVEGVGPVTIEKLRAL